MDVLLPVTIFLVVSISFFVGLLYLHSSSYTTEKALALRQSNQALDYHFGKISAELGTVNASLASLTEAERKVQEKLAANNAVATDASQEQAKSPAHQKIDLKRLLKKTRSKTTDILHQAKSSNAFFGYSISLSPTDFALLTNIPSLHPINYTSIASGYGVQINPFHKGNYFHRGVDFVAPRGTAVRSSASGRVTEVKISTLPMGDGNIVEIDHGNGFKTRYERLGDVHVKTGQSIAKGFVIASVGMTGSSVSPHLHFEILRNNKQVDPIGFLLEESNPIDFITLRQVAKQKNQSLD